MIRYLGRRLLGLVLVLFGLSVAVFFLCARLPGGTALAILGPYATPERSAEFERALGLNHSLPVQYWRWLTRLVRGDWGQAYSMDRPVRELVFEHLGPTLLLGASALCVACVLGLFAGTLSAAYSRRVQDRALTLAALVGISTPSFWLAMLLMLGFAVVNPWFPVSGMKSPLGPGAGGALDVAQHLVLPAMALGLTAAAVIARLMKNEMLDALQLDFTKLARAKGLPESDVRYRHAFLLAFSRVIPVIGLQTGYVLGGAVYVETIFQWPGLGRLVVDAISKRDILLVQGGVLTLASCYVIINLLTDLAQRGLDPRSEA